MDLPWQALLFQKPFDCLNAMLNLSVGLWKTRAACSVLKFPVPCKACKCSTIKLWAIIRYDVVWDPWLNFMAAIAGPAFVLLSRMTSGNLE